MSSRFGEAQYPQTNDFAPNGIYPWEIDLPMREMRTLKVISEDLITLVSLPVNSTLFKLFLVQLNLLWAISEDETIYICPEMISAEDPLCSGGDLVLYPRGLNFSHITRARPKKIGHAAMLNGQPGRICGEIRLVDSKNGPVWEINNNSGRYGRNCGRTREQLEAVALEFRKLKINVKVEFYGPEQAC